MTHAASRTPKVYLVGAGPGDPGLITVKGLECIRRADVIVYDHLASPDLLRHVRDDAQRIYVGKEAGQHTLRQEDINRLLVEKASSGATVTRLKGGDPFVFGRGGEECAELARAGIEFEVVPGITSGIAAPAYAGIPVTHRSCASTMALVTGHEDPEKSSSTIHWEHLARGVDTLVFYMGISNLPRIAQELIRHGRSPQTPAAVIQWGTTARHRSVKASLETIAQRVAEEGITPPAITVVGEVVGLGDSLAWYERRPLLGRRFVNTRTRRQASALTGRLSGLGAEVHELPTIEIVPSGAESELDALVRGEFSFDWIIFTSENGVRAFFDRLLHHRRDVRAVGSARFAAIGPATARAVGEYHLVCDVVARDAVAEGLVTELRDSDSWRGRRVLMPRAETAREILPETLRTWGADVRVVTAYRTVPPKSVDAGLVDRLVRNDYDLITFSSSSTFLNFVELLGRDAWEKVRPALKAASIGPITSATIRDHGVEPVVEAREHTIEGLVNVIQEYCTA